MSNWERSQRAAQERRIKESNCKLDNDLHVLLQDIEFDQEVLNRDLTKLYSMLGQYPMLEKRWQEFQAQGGISADDYRAFLRHRFAPRKVLKRKHLRLIVTNTRQKSKSLPRHRLHPKGDDAA